MAVLRRATLAVLRRCVLFDPLAVSRTGDTVLQTGLRVPRLSISNAKKVILPRFRLGKPASTLLSLRGRVETGFRFFFRRPGTFSGRQPGC